MLALFKESWEEDATISFLWARKSGVSNLLWQSNNNNNNKVASQHTFFSVSIAQIGASDFMELAIGYFIVWTQEPGPEITNLHIDFSFTNRERAYSWHGQLSTAVIVGTGRVRNV